MCTNGQLSQTAFPRISTLNGDNRYQVLLQEYADITRPTRRSETTHQVVHHITTRGPPVAERARRLHPEKLKAARAEFNCMLEEGICQPSNSQWASPFHMVKKKSGEWRPCGDYRRLNSVTVPDRYPLPHIHDVAHRFHECSVFTTIDLLRAYHQIPVAPEDTQNSSDYTIRLV